MTPDPDFLALARDVSGRWALYDEDEGTRDCTTGSIHRLAAAIAAALRESYVAGLDEAADCVRTMGEALEDLYPDAPSAAEQIIAAIKCARVSGGKESPHGS